MSGKILIVEDEPRERNAISRLLRMAGWGVITAQGVPDALAHQDESPALVLTDLRLGQQTGIELMRRWRETRSTPFIVLTAYGDVASAVEAMKLGARDYLTKPASPEALLNLVRRICDEHQIETAAPIADGGFTRLIGQSVALTEVVERARRAAQADSPVLILGESGTGKELLAEAIHRSSRRAQGPFIAVNMAAIPEGLVESELFGHVKGAFTGATSDRIGRFESAERGTIFIDEIGDFKLSAQASLLRVLETRKVTPVGGSDERGVDARVVAATSRRLPDRVAEGKFRDDLFYRLNVLTLQIPPLRERREDIGPLLEHYVRDLSQDGGRPAPQVSAELVEFAMTYPWPGNVRQLRNAVQSMLVMSAAEVLTINDLPDDLSQLAGSENIPPAVGTLDEIERSAVLAALEEQHGNRTRAAASLGISVRTLQRKLKSWSDNG